MSAITAGPAAEVPGPSAGFDSYRSPAKGVNARSIPTTPESCCSSTASANSIVSRYGYDLSRDFAVLTKVEELCDRMVEPEELQQAVEMLQDTRPTVRQIAEVIMTFSPPCTDLDEEGCSMAGTGSMLADLPDPDDLTSLQQLFEEAMEGCMGFSEDGDDSLITPRTQCSSQSIASSSTLKNTPSIPSLSLGTMKKNAMRMGALPSYRAMLTNREALLTNRDAPLTNREALLTNREAMMTGRDTVRTRRRMNQVLDPALFRVLLPTVARKAAGRYAERQARRLQGLPTARPTARACHGGAQAVAAAVSSGSGDKQEVLEPHTAGRPSADDLDQRHLVGVRRSHHYQAQTHPKKTFIPVRNPKLSLEPKLPPQQEDVAHARDVTSSSTGSTGRGNTGAAGNKLRRSSRVHRSIASHALGAAWWAEYAIDEEEEEVLLPEGMWSIHTALQHGAPDTLSARISGRSQLAQTAYSLVYTALLDGVAPVVLKVLDVSREDLLANAFAEASVLDSLRSWHGSVKMLACGRSSDHQVQLVLQRCDKNLRHWAAEQRGQGGGAAWAQAALAMFHDVVGLVCELHGRGVAHCDLKLDNVLLLDGTPLLSDFSEAVTYADASQAQLHESRGTEAYQPPEMFMGRGADARAADVWALGCLLYELLTGKTLFPGQGDCLRPTMAGGQAGSWMSASEEDTLAAALGRSSEVVRAAQGVLGATLVAAEQRVGMERLLELSRQLAQAAVHAQGDIAAGGAGEQEERHEGSTVWADWDGLAF